MGLKSLRWLESKMANILVERCYDQVEVVVDENRPKTLNVFLSSMKKNLTAGPQFVLELAAAALKEGYNVRFLIYMFSIPDSLVHKYLSAYPEPICNLSGKVEILDMTNLPKISVNPNDMTIATIWNSAYYAEQIQSHCTNKKFMYMLGDDERQFFSAGSLYNCIEQTYFMDSYPIFSIDILRDYFLAHDVGRFRELDSGSISPAFYANADLPSKEVFLKERSGKKKLLVYLRKHEARNCYELVIHTLKRAVREGIINPNEWEIVGCGAEGNKKIKLGKKVFIKQMKMMSLKKYKSELYKYDVGLILMRTPHTSTPVVDFSLSGLVTLTNSCGNRTQEEYNKMSKNIIAAVGMPDSLLAGLKEAIARASNLEERYNNAANSKFPRTFTQVWSKRHQDWLNNIMKTH